MTDRETRGPVCDTWAMSTQPSGLSQVRARLHLEYPMSLGTFEKYEEAQKLVDTLPTRSSRSRTA